MKFLSFDVQVKIFHGLEWPVTVAGYCFTRCSAITVSDMWWKKWSFYCSCQPSWGEMQVASSSIHSDLV